MISITKTGKAVRKQRKDTEIWQELSYTYKANLKEPEMIDLLRTRSGLVNVTAYSRTHWDKIVEFERKIRSIVAIHADEKYAIYLALRMYSINVPVSRSIKLTHRSVTQRNEHGDDNTNPREYLITEADYNPLLGLDSHTSKPLTT